MNGIVHNNSLHETGLSVFRFEHSCVFVYFGYFKELTCYVGNITKFNYYLRYISKAVGLERWVAFFVANVIKMVITESFEHVRDIKGGYLQF